MLKNLFRRLVSASINPPPLGRWCLKDKSKNHWKIDMANIDHCGTCSNERAKDRQIMKVISKDYNKLILPAKN